MLWMVGGAPSSTNLSTSREVPGAKNPSLRYAWNGDTIPPTLPTAPRPAAEHSAPWRPDRAWSLAVRGRLAVEQPCVWRIAVRADDTGADRSRIGARHPLNGVKEGSADVSMRCHWSSLTCTACRCQRSHGPRSSAPPRLGPGPYRMSGCVPRTFSYTSRPAPFTRSHSFRSR